MNNVFPATIEALLHFSTLTKKIVDIPNHSNDFKINDVKIKFEGKNINCEGFVSLTHNFFERRLHTNYSYLS